MTNSFNRSQSSWCLTCEWQNVWHFLTAFVDVIRKTIWWLDGQPKEHEDHSHHQNTALKTQISPPHRPWLGEQAALRLLLGSSGRDRKGCRSKRLLPGRLLLCHVHYLASCLRAKVQGSELNIQPRYICWARHLHRWRRDLKTQRVKKRKIKKKKLQTKQIHFIWLVIVWVIYWQNLYICKNRFISVQITISWKVTGLPHSTFVTALGLWVCHFYSFIDL